MKVLAFPQSYHYFPKCCQKTGQAPPRVLFFKNPLLSCPLPNLVERLQYQQTVDFYQLRLLKSEIQFSTHLNLYLIFIFSILCI